MRLIILLSIAVLVTQCQSDAQYFEPVDNSDFAKYWYAGEAEITSYELEQARYGQIHEGEGILIFVTEDFSKSKQVKLDEPGMAGNDAIKVLKLNAMRQFNTGIYQYNMMRSVFSPVDVDQSPHTLKVTMSSQDWCGQSWLQLNHENDGFRAAQFSYFESEGDRKADLPEVMLEDEIWTRIRLAPESLPQGSVSLIPGSFYIRLKHADLKAQKATATLTEDSDVFVYSVNYSTIDRELSIRFSKSFPYQIEGWTETYQSGFGTSSEHLETKATRKERLNTAYWKQNQVTDLELRRKLDLKT